MFVKKYLEMKKSKKTIPLDQVMRALGDPIRLSAVRQLLDEKEKPCGTFDHDVAKATFSHHIKILEEVGIIKSRLDGNKKLMSINQDFEKMFPGIISLIIQEE